MDQGEIYVTELSIVAKNRYRTEVLTYLIQNFSLERVLEIDKNITDKISSLSRSPKIGRLIVELEKLKQEFRFILHKETRAVEVKIIYYINEEINKIIISDIFPTQKDLRKLTDRS